MEIHAPQSEPSEAQRAVTMKFTYPSGSKPLEGYTIKRGVGRGGFGEVYFGTSDAGKEVALKLIRRNLDVELRGVRQCLNLKHPNLVALYDIKSDEVDDRWVVMEYVSGESLEDAIDRNPNGMPVPEALQWIHGICAGVAYLHDHGIVHRDLKPGNIFCDEGVVKVGDYGLAKFISCSRRSGQTESVGTVHYMAPEIANGRYGREIDTYALGIILYETLTGKVPFEGESVGEVLMKHLTAEPDLSELEEPYRTIVQKALAKDPDCRLDSVAELAAMLPPAPDGAGYVCRSTPPMAAHDRPGSASPNGAGPARHGGDLPPKVEVAEVVDAEEPILAGIRNGWNYLEQSWREADMHPTLRIFLIVVAVIALVFTAQFWITGLFVAFIVYGIYWLFRAIVVKPKKVRYRVRTQKPVVEQNVTPAAKLATIEQGPPVKAAEPAPIAPAARRQRRHHAQNLRQHLADLVAKKPFRIRFMELVGSMLVSGLVAMTMSLVLLVLTSGGQFTPGPVIWFSVVGMLGAWAIIIPSKFAEGKVEDQASMRFIMLIMGLLVGGAAAGLYNVMAVQLPMEGELTQYPPFFGQTIASPSKIPLVAFVGYFGFLYVILRWWIQASWIRNARLSLWTVGCCVFWAWLLHLFWWFPQPAGMMIAAVIAVTVQFSSPWLPMSQRRREL
ncbi:MAG: protein kinase [Pirellulales bacterium]|nr:protein kinase [Pirellulales bacterium]